MFIKKLIKTTILLAAFIASSPLLAGKYNIDVEVEVSEGIRKRLTPEQYCSLWWCIPDVHMVDLLWSRHSGDKVTISTDREEITTNGVSLGYSMRSNNAPCGEPLAYRKDGQTLKSLKIKLDYNDFTNSGEASLFDVVYK